jgi:hypothetical protein
MKIRKEVIVFLIKLALPANHRHSESPRPCSEQRDTKDGTHTLYHVEDWYRYITIHKVISLQTVVFMIKYLLRTNKLNLLFNMNIQGDQKISVHLMITIHKVTSNIQSFPLGPEGH